MKTILITGGAGFIGSHLCEYILKKGDSVICVDNLFTGRKKNIQHLRDNSNFTLKIHDIIDPLFLDYIDQIYNLACPASPIHYQYNAIRTIKANTAGVINILGLAKKHKARILQASTSEVYGDPTIHPQTEEYKGNVNCIGPRACYDEGKRVAETILFDYHRREKVDIRIARIFNTYGPKMASDDGRVISNFIVQALKNQPLTIYGKGLQTRSFCYISDLVRGLYQLMNGEFKGPINLGNPQERTIIDTANKVIKLSNSTSEIKYQSLPEDDPKRRQPDITKAKEFLGWMPEIDFEEGLKKTIQYFKTQLQ